MRIILGILILIIGNFNLFSQGQQFNYVTAEIVYVSPGVVKVDFTPTESLMSLGEINPLNIWLKVPGGSSDPVPNITLGSNPYGLSLAGNSVLNGVRYIRYQSVTAFSASGWTVGTPVTIATFNVSGVPSISLSGGDITPHFQTNIWRGTALVRALNNYVSYPITSNAPLPVKLTTFSAEQCGDRASKLDWTTSSEENSDYFGIERSEDGISWTTIGNVRAAGNSSSKLEYSYIDNKLPLTRSKEQIFYYRLRMTDLDGKFEYSDIRGVNFTRSAEVDIQIYPNPTSDLINVDLSGFDLEAGDIHLGVYDNSGRKLMAKKILGNGIELLDVSHLPAATYQVAVEQGNIHHRQTIIKID